MGNRPPLTARTLSEEGEWNHAMSKHVGVLLLAFTVVSMGKTLSAQDAPVQDDISKLTSRFATVTFEVHNSTLSEMIHIIAENAGIDIRVTVDAIKEPVRVDFRDVPFDKSVRTAHESEPPQLRNINEKT
jgi:hypothetical protein